MPYPEIEGEIERIRQIYQCDVLQKANREVELLGRKCGAQILSTFLGFELKMGRKRVTCPDLASARYLKIFGELGLKAVRIPYDPTRTEVLASGLEHALTRIQELMEQRVPDTRKRQAALRRTYARIRSVCQAANG